MKRREIKKEFTVVGQDMNTSALQTTTAQPMEAQVSFDSWWLQIQTKHKLRSELKTAVRKHFEAKGFMNDSKKFTDGLRDFGFNV